MDKNPYNENLQRLIEQLLIFASNPTKEGSKQCKQLISEVEESGADGKLKIFLYEAYHLLRPYKGGPGDIKNLLEKFLGRSTELNCEIALGALKLIAGMSMHQFSYHKAFSQAHEAATDALIRIEAGRKKANE